TGPGRYCTRSTGVLPDDHRGNHGNAGLGREDHPGQPRGHGRIDGRGAGRLPAADGAKRIDTATGESVHVPVPCGATQSAVCPSCADKARRLRMHQAREGWHLTEEPEIETQEPT